MQHESPRAVDVCVLIPAYRPGASLIDVVKGLTRHARYETVVVVDDGSGREYASIFEAISRLPQVHVITKALNRGKGAALRIGIQFILREHPEVRGVVTADADGQHDPQDILRMCDRFREAPDAFVLGVRSFNGSIPLRSQIGNRFTYRLIHTLLGNRISDSQTGLRAIPRALLEKLPAARASGYEFELEMLIAAKHMGLPIVERPIRTIYHPGNPSSHFRPLRDSMRIGYVLLRFSFIGLLSAVLDNFVFYLLFRETGNVLLSQVVARVVSAFYNYTAVRRAVFLSDVPHAVLLPRYLLLAAANCAMSYMGITILVAAIPVNVFGAKLMAETLLFFANLVVEREWIFKPRTISQARKGGEQPKALQVP